MLILSQGNLAPEMLAAARAIVGELPRFAAVGLAWEDDAETARAKIGQALAGFEAARGTLILTDTFGATPHNVALTFHRPGEVEVLSGVNLPMVIRLGCCGEEHLPLGELATWIQRKARGAICSSVEDEPDGSGPRAARRRGTAGGDADRDGDGR